KFNSETGELTAPSSTRLSDVLNIVKGTNWFPPVLPGTQFVTVGGAIANDIHGKNHGHRGTFGRHIKRLMLRGSDGAQTACSLTENPELFAATIGGLGLTGFIEDATLQLMPVDGQTIETRNQPFSNLDGFFELVDEAESHSEYCVAWVDSIARGKRFGRGVLITGNHVPGGPTKTTPSKEQRRLSVPFTPPFPLVSGLALRAFNEAYFQANSRKTTPRRVTPDSFFFPLDAIGGWNRLYGPNGLYQHQSVLPRDTAKSAVKALLTAAQDANQGSFLTVLKAFGDLPSPGLLSFPKEGFTLTLDFPNRGQRTRAMLDALDAIVLDAGGRINPYKDARMAPKTFQTAFPNWRELEAARDENFQSNFWKRVTSPALLLAPPLVPSLEMEPVNQPKQGELHTSHVVSNANALPAQIREKT
ncbi:MAG: FAD-binding oxidoreductase, partial [Pseudomonadota bacterium]